MYLGLIKMYGTFTSLKSISSQASQQT